MNETYATCVRHGRVENRVESQHIILFAVVLKSTVGGESNIKIYAHM